MLAANDRPPPLAYDDLPPGSDLRRESSAGGLTVIVPAGDVPQGMCRAASSAAMLWAAAVSAPLLGLLVAAGSLAYWDNLRRMEPALRAGAEVLFAAFALGLFALIWRTRRDAHLEALARGRRQSTVLHVTPLRLLIETTGPYGDASYDLPRDQVRSLDVCRFQAGDAWGATVALPWVVITLTDGTSIRLLPGRDQIELRWVAGAVTQAAHAQRQ